MPASKLPAECRAKCDRCHGHGSHAGLALASCETCFSQGIPCELHVCWQCRGSGLVCPQCRGMRHVRKNEWDVHRGTSVETIRCPVCCEGNNVSEGREDAVIDRYMARWRTEHDRFKKNGAS